MNLYNTDDFKEQKEVIIQITTIMIIYKWSLRIEEYLQKLNKRSEKISRELYEDYKEFIKKENFIGNFFKSVNVKTIFFIFVI